MEGSLRFELNNPPVVAELVEGEAIAINLKSGCYYSLTGAAGSWQKVTTLSGVTTRLPSLATKLT